jgi:hypothetical protein
MSIWDQIWKPQTLLYYLPARQLLAMKYSWGDPLELLSFVGPILCESNYRCSLGLPVTTDFKLFPERQQNYALYDENCIIVTQFLIPGTLVKVWKGVKNTKKCVSVLILTVFAWMKLYSDYNVSSINLSSLNLRTYSAFLISTDRCGLNLCPFEAMFFNKWPKWSSSR